MKKIIILISVIAAFTGCNLFDKSPTVQIVSPSNGDVFPFNEDVTVYAEVEDPDGFIHEVRLYVDGAGINSLTTFPYEFVWNTGDSNQGEHTIKVVGEDDQGLESENEVTIIVGQAPEADFAVNDYIHCIDSLIQFNDSSLYSPTSWIWDFGDGDTSHKKNPIHHYSDFGQYNVKLTVANEFGDDEITKNEFIIINETCKGEFFDPRDGFEYNTITIGDQVWMTEDLAYKLSDGCWVYDDEDAFRPVLYNWEAAKIACPPGWHLPSNDEWNELIEYCGGATDAGERLKSYSWYGGISENIRFNAIGSGFRDVKGNYSQIYEVGYWWSVDESNAEDAWSYIMYAGKSNDNVDNFSMDKQYGFSVRCIKD